MIDFLLYINLNGLYNRIDNLELCTPSEQVMNRRLVKRSKCDFKGLTKVGNKYRVRVFNQRTGKRENIGSFDNQLDAAKAYDARIIELYGDRIITNKKLGYY